jgi:hypothetical protein
VDGLKTPVEIQLFQGTKARKHSSYLRMHLYKDQAIARKNKGDICSITLEEKFAATQTQSCVDNNE